MYQVNRTDALTSLSKLEKELKQVIQTESDRLLKAPAGGVKIMTVKGVHYYYHSLDKKLVYLSKKKSRRLIRQLVQKQYSTKILKRAQTELSLVQRFYASINKSSLSSIYDSLPEARQNLITPAIPVISSEIQKWISKEYTPKPSGDATNLIKTDKGELVRSKSEVFIANQLNKRQIPYRYEAPLYLDQIGIIHPDFTILNPRTLEEIYWEHLGLIQDPDYALTAFQRLLAYQNSGLYPGKRLIITMETLRYPLSPALINKYIDTYCI